MAVLPAETRGVVVVTGASSGIGEACALHLDRIGFHVLAGVRRSEDGERLMDAASDRLEPVNLDVTHPPTIQLALQRAEAKVAEIGFRGLVNNAGIAIGGPLEYLSLAELRHQFEVNLFGPLALTQACMPLIRRWSGRILFIGSTSGLVATPLLGPYAASKFALEALVDSLRVELSPWSIPVALIQPGAVATPIWEKSLATAKELVKKLPADASHLYEPILSARQTQSIRRGRAGISPERVARVVGRALTDRHPKTRYRVGWDAWVIFLFARLVPDRIRDALITRFMKMPTLSE